MRWAGRPYDATSRGAAVLPAVAAVLSLVATPAPAGDQNEVAAFLVFPTVLNKSSGEGQPLVETLITVSNAGPAGLELTLLFFDGDSCAACAVQRVPVEGSGSVTFVFTSLNGSAETRIQTLDGTISQSCPGGDGFAAVYSESGGVPQTENVLFGSAVIADYEAGASSSVPAVVAQGIDDVGDGSLQFRFDDQQYSRIPRWVAGNFFAPGPDTRYQARLSLFTLGFTSGTPPTVRCSIGGQDASGGPIGGGLFEQTFEITLLFDCWTDIDLRELSPEFAFPALGLQGFDEHGGIQIDCEVDSDGDGVFDGDGGVHGALAQRADAGTTLIDREGGAADGDPQAPVSSGVAWARLLNQSVTTGDIFTLTVEACNGVDDDGDGDIDEGCDDDGDDYCEAGLLAGGAAPPICPAGFGDCNDDDPSVFPGADELCDGLDNDCDGSVDEDPVNPPLWYVDADGDGFGDPRTGVAACDPPAGSVGTGTDCDDSDPTVFHVPHEIQNVHVGPGGEVSWDSDAPNSGSATEYDVLRGETPQLPVQGTPGETCLPSPGTATSLVDPSDAPPGGFYYLVRGRNACGLGSYGEGRSSPACP